MRHKHRHTWMSCVYKAESSRSAASRKLGRPAHFLQTSAPPVSPPALSLVARLMVSTVLVCGMAMRIVAVAEPPSLRRLLCHEHLIQIPTS